MGTKTSQISFIDLIFIRVQRNSFFKIRHDIVACLPKAKIVKPAETVVERERFCKRPLLGNSSVAVTRCQQQTRTQQHRSRWMRCFL
jgi:hypothetical protein